MKKSVVLLLVFVLLLSLSLTASAKVNRSTFTGTNVIQYFIDPPTPERCTTNPANVQRCRDIVLVTQTDTTDERLNGYEVLTINRNWRMVGDLPLGEGPWWGTGVMRDGAVDDPTAEITWTSKFHGQAYADGSSTMHAVLTGHGKYEGLKAFVDGVRRPDNFFTLYLTGYVVEKD